MIVRAEVELLELIPEDEVVEIVGDANVSVSGLAYDSRRVQPGDAFFCLPGTRADGHAFAPEAVARGAVALIVARPLEIGGPVQVRVRNPRRALALAATRMYGYPSRSFSLIGVTGTNGKTTTSFMIESILRAAGKTTGLIGTVEYRIAGEAMPVTHTTPESLELQELFYLMAQSGVSHAVMEVSSHAIDQDRIAGAEFDALVFTNLSQDHLDYHGTMAEYEKAKARLFLERCDVPWIVNAGDDAGRRLLEAGRAAGARVVPYGIVGAIPDGFDGAVVGKVLEATRRGTVLEMTAGGDTGAIVITLPLRGRFNAINALAAAAVTRELGIPLDAIVAGLEACPQVPGRFEAVDVGQDFLAVVDYAHTPDSLEKVLSSARALLEADGRLIAVFGCGGDRDRGKRPLMGAVAATIADSVIVTSDNPRSEEPEAIIDEIVAGIPAELAYKVQVEVDRRAAIRRALSLAGPRDVVVVAGKGHETYQIFKDKTVHFDDREEIKEGIEALGLARAKEEPRS